MDSLDREIGGDEGKTTLGELMADDTFKSTDYLINEYDVKNEVDRMLNTLDTKSKRVIIAMYGLDGTLPMTLAEVGLEFGVTRETIRQIKEKTLTKLKAKLDNSTLKSIFQG
jgi:RNA polymerase primary sigma factor